MTTYGTIPTSDPPANTNLEFVSRAKDRIRAGLGTRRPWDELLSPAAISFPDSAVTAAGRISTNAAYFRMNYAVVVLFVLFLCLLYHPLSLMVFVVMMAAWLFLYFLRDEPLVVYNQRIEDGSVLVGLFFVTIVVLFLTNVTGNIVAGLVIGAATVMAHGAVRRIDDLVLDEEGGEVGSAVPWHRMPITVTAV